MRLLMGKSTSENLQHLRSTGVLMLQSKRIMEESSRETRDVPPERIQHYQSRAERLVNQYGRNFTEFTKDNERLVAIGDELIRTYETTGYNFLRSVETMHLTSRKPLIFYSNYTGRTRHFGLLLSQMEQKELITPKQIRLNVKASRVLYGGWEIDALNERIIEFQRQDEFGKISYDKVSQTVDTTVTFSLRDEENALAIALFLKTRASGLNPGSIEGSFDIPDIIATPTLRGTLMNAGFEEVVANILTLGKTQLIAGRRSTGFARPWQNVSVELNEELASYLTSGGVVP